MDVLYRQLHIEDITLEIFLPFNRYQEVEQCWRKVDGRWVLQDIPFVDDWGESEKIFLVKCLQNTIGSGGMVLGAFHDDTLVGFASLENDLFGSKNQYLQLSSIHTSHEFRGHGIGKSLFQLMCRRAEGAGARKLYISAHSSKETQAFYRSIGCVEAIEINERLLEKEPFDCQLEYDLGRYPDEGIRKLAEQAQLLATESEIAALEAKHGTTPNTETIAAMKELDEGEGTRFSSPEELFRDLGI